MIMTGLARPVFEARRAFIGAVLGGTTPSAKPAGIAAAPRRFPLRTLRNSSADARAATLPPGRWKDPTVKRPCAPPVPPPCSAGSPSTSRAWRTVPAPATKAPLAAQLHQLQQEAAALENIKRPGYWNSATGDMFSQLITRTDMWPADRCLRIIDCARDTITLIAPDGTLRTHQGRSATLLPEPAANEVVLMRSGAHYVRITPEEEVVVRDVPADGDCFFSCISDAFGVPPEGRHAHNLRLRGSIARLVASDPILLMIACVSDHPLPDGAPVRP